MSTNAKSTRRTQGKDLPRPTKELAAKEAKQVKGGLEPAP